MTEPWARDAGTVVAALGVLPEHGLDRDEVARRLQTYGHNRLRETRRTSIAEIFINQLKSLIVALLLCATAVSLMFGEWVEGAAIGAAILIAVLLGFITELRAIRSMEALRLLGTVDARVRRGGRDTLVPARDLVPGDIVLIEGGDRITADLRVLEASKLQADESTLTGESLPVGKDDRLLDKKTPLAERRNMLYKGTVITRGSGLGVVVATAMNTELGHIAALVEEADSEVTPLEKRLAALGRRLIGVSLLVAVIATISGIITGKDVLLMIETGIALAVAAIPEGLPIVATMALARGMWRMARQNALVNHLAAVETLGATSVIVADKTGTLTENRMTVTRVALDAGDVEVTENGFVRHGQVVRGHLAHDADHGDADAGDDACLRAALEVAALCNNASLGHDTQAAGTGDPLEIALLAAAAKAGIHRAELTRRAPERREEAFDSNSKMMATFHELDEGVRVAVKGAPEAVLACTTRVMTRSGRVLLDSDTRARWLERSEALAHDGLRVLAVAEKSAPGLDAEPYAALTLIGLVGMFDPPRTEVVEPILACRRAGIRVIMATGDQPVTARNIARAVGLLNEQTAGAQTAGAQAASAQTADDRAADHDAAAGSDAAASRVVLGSELGEFAHMTAERRKELCSVPIFARVTPEQKLDIISLHQDRGAVVAMTGDGVNDAPALKKADIGVAMGKRGTDVAREAADMLLKDDSFASIVDAIRQGRVIFQNIRRFVVYLLSCNTAEIMLVTGAAMTGSTLPILPLQILFLNLVTDVFPALALGFGEGDPGIMDRPPRDPGEAVLARRHWLAIALYGVIITASVFVAFYTARRVLDMPDAGAVSISFLTLGFAQLVHVFNMRDQGSRWLGNDVVRSPWIWSALFLCTALLMITVYVAPLARILGVQDPGLDGWAVILACSLIPWALGQIWLTLAPRPRVRPGRPGRDTGEAHP